MKRNENVSGANLCLKKKMFKMLLVMILLEKIPVILISPALSLVSPALPKISTVSMVVFICSAFNLSTAF